MVSLYILYTVLSVCPSHPPLSVCTPISPSLLATQFELCLTLLSLIPQSNFYMFYLFSSDLCSSSWFFLLCLIWKVHLVYFYNFHTPQFSNYLIYWAGIALLRVLFASAAWGAPGLFPCCSQFSFMPYFIILTIRLLILKISILCVWGFCLSVCAPQAYSTSRGQKRALELEFMKLELQMFVRHCVGSGNWVLVLCKKSQWAESLSHSSSPRRW